MIARPRWNKRVADHFRPVGSRDESGDDVSKENRGQPFHDHRDLVIAKLNCRVSNTDTENQNVNVRINSGQHLGRVSHAGKIRAYVDSVSD